MMMNLIPNIPKKKQSFIGLFLYRSTKSYNFLFMIDEKGLTSSDSLPVINPRPVPKLSNFLKLFAIDTTKKLMSYPISAPFNKTDKTITNTVPEYYSKVKSPQIIDLTTILSKLNSDCYIQIEEWEKDVETVWSNFIDFYPNNSPFSLIAKELKKKYIKQISQMPTSEVEYWASKMQKENRKIQKYIEQMKEMEQNFDNQDDPNESAKENEDENEMNDEKHIKKNRIILKREIIEDSA